MDKKKGRLEFFEQCLGILGYEDSYRAYELVKDEMCNERGFSRHDGKHYYYHLVDVAQGLINKNVRVQDIITAALLHDITEDVLNEDKTPKFPIELLAEMFNPNVAKMVELLTKNPKIDYKKNKKALIAYYKAISEDVGASLIKTEDKSNNSFDLLETEMNKRLRLALEIQDHFIPFIKECRERYPYYAAIFFEAKTKLEQHAAMIKQYHERIEKQNEKIKRLEAKRKEGLFWKK